MIITPIQRPYNIDTITVADSPYDVVELDRVIRIDASGGNVTINLKKLNPLVIKKIEADTSTNEIIIVPDGGQTILGTTELRLRAPGENLQILLNGTDWETFN